MSYRIGSVVIVVLSLALRAHAGGIVPMFDGRTLFAQFSDPYFFETLGADPPVPFAAWADLVNAGGAYLASQNSGPVTASGVSASGEASGGSEDGSARSTFSLSFEVTEATPYTLSGELEEHVFAMSDAFISLSQGSTVLFQADAGGGVLPFLDTGILAPGIYELVAEAEWTDTAEIFGPPARFTFDFVVPEPATGGLVALGCLALAVDRRRRARS